MPRQSTSSSFSGVALASIDDASSAAETIGDPLPRSLDAIHLATALAMQSTLTAFVTYDKRLATAASAADLPVAAPA